MGSLLPRRITVGVNAAYSFGRGIAEGVIAYSRSVGNWVLTLRLDTDPTVHRLAIDARGSTGIIASLTQFDPSVKLPCPIMNVVDGPAVGHVATVCIDNERVGVIAAEHLIDRGYKQFAAFQRANLQGSVRRCDAFASRLAAAGMSCERLDVDVDGEDQIVNWLGKRPHPLGVMCFGLVPALTLVETAWRIGRRIPEQLGIIVGDDDPMLCESGHVRLTTVLTPLQEIGFEAARSLDRWLDHPDRPLAPDFVNRIPPRGIVVRESSDTWVTSDDTVTHAVQLIRDRPDRTATIQDLASAVNLSPRHLQRIFSDRLGRPIGSVIMRARLDQARRLLATTDLAIKQIAISCGFKSNSLFCKTFREHERMTPLAYRRATSSLLPRRS